MTVLVRNNTAAAATAAAPALFDQLDKALKSDEGKELVAKTKVCLHCQNSSTHSRTQDELLAWQDTQQIG